MKMITLKMEEWDQVMGQSILDKHRDLLTLLFKKFLFIFRLHWAACGILVPWLGIEPAPLAVEAVLTNGPPRMSLPFFKVLLSCVRLLVIPLTLACQAPLSMGFSKQEYWGGLPVPSPGDLPNPGIKPGSPALQADALPDINYCLIL